MKTLLFYHIKLFSITENIVRRVELQKIELNIFMFILDSVLSNSCIEKANTCVTKT